jgi:hypothetical protein
VARDELHVIVGGLLEVGQRKKKVYSGKEGMHEESENWKEEKHVHMHKRPNKVRVRVFSIHGNGW